MRTRTARRVVALALALTSLLVTVPSAQAAKKPKFRVSVTVFQEAEWQVLSQSDDLCGGSNVFNVYSGEGSGYLRAKSSRARVTFTKTRTGLTSSEFRAPGEAFREATYSSSREGFDEDCDPPAPAQVNTDACGLIIRRTGTARMHLLVLPNGRLTLTGGFYEPRSRPRCPDASGRTGGIGYSGPSRGRRDVGKLLQNKRVRSIELSSSVKNDPLGADDVSPSPGFDVRSASGEQSVRWKVKLTRLR